jgi:hypothetical protein
MSKEQNLFLKNETKQAFFLVDPCISYESFEPIDACLAWHLFLYECESTVAIHPVEASRFFEA